MMNFESTRFSAFSGCVLLDKAINVRIMFGMIEDDFTFRDALPRGPAHRRGAGLNPGNRFEDIRLHVYA